eukprot:scaffold80587_cov18-Tisochrysis_lutea.AAC.1
MDHIAFRSPAMPMPMPMPAGLSSITSSMAAWQAMTACVGPATALDGLPALSNHAPHHRFGAVQGAGGAHAVLQAEQHECGGRFSTSAHPCVHASSSQIHTHEGKL